MKVTECNEILQIHIFLLASQYFQANNDIVYDKMVNIIATISNRTPLPYNWYHII